MANLEELRRTANANFAEEAAERKANEFQKTKAEALARLDYELLTLEQILVKAKETEQFITEESIRTKVSARYETNLIRAFIERMETSIEEVKKAREIVQNSTDITEIKRNRSLVYDYILERDLSYATTGLKKNYMEKVGDVTARKNATKRKIYKALHPVKYAKLKKMASRAYVLKEEKKKQRRIEAIAKREEEARQQRIDEAHSEIAKIDALYDPNKVGKYERTEEHTEDGSRKYTRITTTIHTKYGPLVCKKYYNDNFPNEAIITIKGYAKVKVDEVDQIMYYHRSFQVTNERVGFDDWDTFYNLFDGFMKADGQEVVLCYGDRQTSKIGIKFQQFEGVEKYFEEQLKASTPYSEPIR